MAALERWVLGVSQVTLDNGLRVVLAPDATSPTVSVCVTYDVGSRNETKGQSGFAHLFEHMMFQGSRNLAKGGHFQLVTSRGGQLNGSTSTEVTNYFETLPDNELELGLWLEADRMRWLDVNPENFENQRAVVQEEYRMRVESTAYEPALIELDRHVFKGFGPYEHPTIGSMADLDAAKFEWVRDFHKTYYGPNNAILSLSGGFDPDYAVELIHRYFAPVETKPLVPFVPPAVPPVRTQENRLVLKDANAKTQALLFGWRIPPAGTDAHFALEMVARVLADGDSSLLYDQLVRKKAWARDVSAYTGDRRDVDSFVLFIELTEDANPDIVEAFVDSQLKQLVAKGPPQSLLGRARQRTKSAFILGLQSNQSRATVLGEYAALYRNPRLVVRDLQALLQVEPSAISQAMNTYMTKSARTVIRVVPNPAASSSEGTENAEAPAGPTGKEAAR